jgi:two-component system response regulator
MTDKIILLVEDNPRDEELTLRALKKNNIRNLVVVVRDGAEALDYLFASGAHAGRDAAAAVLPEVILLDLKLPKIDGLEVLEMMRRKRALVIMLTGYGDIATAVQAMQLGAENFLTKPVDMPHLVATVERALPATRRSTIVASYRLAGVVFE